MLATYPVTGLTGGDDTVVVTLGTQAHEVVVNGGQPQTVQVAQYDALSIDGLAGTDTLTITGTSEAELGTMYASSGSFHDKLATPVYSVTWSRVENATINGAGGDDDVHLYDSTGDDTFISHSADAEGTSVNATLTGSGYSLAANGFQYVVAHGDNASGTDNAYINGSAADDEFESNQNFGRMWYAGGVRPYVRALYFEEVHATGGGGYDTASLIGVNDSNDTVTLYADGHGSMVRTVGPVLSTILDNAAGFERVDASGDNGGTDAAYLHDSAYDDEFTAAPSIATLKSAAETAAQYELVASGFPVVHAYGDSGGQDRAWMYGSAGDDTWDRFTDRGIVRLYGTGFYNRALNFEIVDGYGEGGTDTATFQDSSSNDLLISALCESGATPQLVTTFAGGGLLATSHDFEQTTTTSQAGSDVACFYQSSTPASDVITSGADWTRYTYPDSAYCQADSYDDVWVVDFDLLDAVREALSLGATEIVTSAQMAQLTHLSLDSSKIESLEGLQLATNLQSLTVLPCDPSHSNTLSDLSPLTDLTSLTNVTLQGLGLEDAELYPLGSLTSLESLDLRYNQIDVIPTAIASLVSLSALQVYGNPLNDAPRDGLVNLKGKLISIDVAPDQPERATNIAELAEALYYLPVEMYEYVVNTIEYEPYRGAMKGPLAVLQTKAGNDWDTASLLAALMTEAERDTRYVYGTVDALKDAYAPGGMGIESYLGVESAVAAMNVLARAGLSPSYNSYDAVRFKRACLQIDISGNGTEWVTLDPAWKSYHNLFTSGPQNCLVDVPFNVEDYLAEPRNELAYEYYENQVREYLAENQPEVTIADIIGGRCIIQQVCCELPNSLPYKAFDWTNTVVSIPEIETHRVQILLKNSAGSVTYLDWTEDLPEIALDSLVLGWTPQQDSVTTLTPVLLLNGSVEVSGSTPINVDTPVSLTVRHILPGGSVLTPSSYVREAGNWIAVGLDAHQASEQLLTSARQAVNDQEIKLLNSGYTATTYDSLCASMLHLAMLTYFYETNRGEDIIARLTGAMPDHTFVASGVATADIYESSSGSFYRTTMGTDSQLQYPYVPKNLGIDIRNGYLSVIDGNDSYAAARDRLLGYTNSAIEAGVWEEVTNIPSICTVGALQLANSQPGNSIVTIDDSNVGQIDSILDGLAPVVRATIAYYVTSQDCTVTVPTENVSVGNDPNHLWVGVGYILTDPSGFGVGYVLHGGVDGEIDDSYGSEAVGTPTIPYVPQPSPASISVLDPMDPTNGNVIHEENDFAIPNLGFALGFSRCYTSFNTVSQLTGAPAAWSDRGMGEGWSFTYSDRLEDGDAGDPTGTKIWFSDTGLKLKFIPEGGGYKTPETVHGTLVYLGTGLGYTWTDTHGNVIAFDDAGKLLSMVDRYGNGVRIEYYAGTSEIHFVFDAQDATNTRKLTFVYTNDHITSVSDFTGRTWTYGYNGSGRLVLVTAPSDAQTAQAVTEYEYYDDDANPATPDGPALAGLLKTVIDPDDGETAYEYYANRRGFRVTDAAGYGSSMSYDLFRYRTAVTNENGDTTWYSYADDGYVVQELSQDRTTVSSVWHNGLRQSVTDAYGQTEKLWYNANGDLVLEEDPEGGAKVFAYTTFTPSTPFSELDWSIDVGKRPDESTPGVLAIDFDDYTIGTFGTGGSTPNNYEVLDDGYTLRLWGDTWKAIPIADYSITANTILEFDFTSSDPGDRHCIGLDDDASFNWPRQFMLYGTGGQAGVTPVFNTYASTGPLTRHYVIPLNRFTGMYGTLAYMTFMNDDATLGSASESIFSNIRLYEAPQGVATTRNFYQDDGSLWKSIDAVGNFPLYTYPATGNRGLPTSSLTPMGRLTSADPDDYKTTYTYNAAGQVLTISSRVASGEWITVSYTYDDRGNMLTSTDGNGRTTNYTYDLLGRQLTATLPDPDDFTGIGGENGLLLRPVTTSTFDKLGNRETVVDTVGRTVSYLYDPMGRLLKTTYTDSDDAILGERRMRYDPAGNLASVADELGHVTRYLYDTRGRCIATVAPDGSAEYTYYDGGGRIVGQENARGNLTECRYDKLGRKIADILPVTTGIDDGAAGFASSGTWTVVSGTGGEEDDYRYASGSSNEATWTFTGLQDDVAYELLITWRPDGVYASTVAPFTVFDGTTVGTLLDTIRVDQKQSPGDDSTYGAGWRSLGRFRSTTGTLTVKLTGTSPGRVIADAVRLVEPRVITYYGYDDQGNLQYVTDTLGTTLGDPNHTTEYQYDLTGRMTAIILPDPDGTGTGAARPTTYYTYDANSNPKTVADPRGNVTTYDYDEVNRKIRETLPDPDGANGPLGSVTTRYFYDANNNLRYVVNALGSDAQEVEHTTEYSYDWLGRKTLEILPDPDGSANPIVRPEIAYAYDDYGNLASVTDARGNVTRYLYDERNRLTQVTDALGQYAGDPAHTAVTVYDAVGNVLTATDPLGRTTKYRYDNRNRKIAEIQPVPVNGQSAPTITYAYDVAGNLTAVTDALGCTTWYSYDNLNRVVSTTDALGWERGDPHHTTTTQYDQLGRVWRATDQLGRTTTYEYDNLGQLIREIQPEFTRYDSQRVSPTTCYGYDANGNLQYVTSPLGGDPKDSDYTTWYAYDALNRQIAVIDPVDADPASGAEPCNGVGELTFSASHAMITAYDALGNVTSVTDAMGQMSTYVYDHLNRTIEAHQSTPGDGSHGAPVTYYGYDANGNLQYTTDPLGSTAKDPNHTTWYVYDALNRQTQIIDALDDDPTTGSEPYDAQGQLISGFTPAHPTTTSYDAVGQTVAVTDPEGNSTQFAYDGLGRLVSETNGLDDTRSYAYDAAGNLTHSTDRNGRETEYTYDSLGRQVEERWLDGSSQVLHTVRYWYDSASQLIGVTELDTAATGWWRFDAGTGTSATDSSGHSHGGTLLNGTTWTSGVRGTAINLDGQNDYVEVPDCPELKYQGGELTLSAWVYVDGTEADGGWLISKPWNGNGEYNYELHLQANNTVSLSLQSQLLLTSPSALSTGQWHSIVATVDDTNLMTLYVDGQSVASDYHTISDWTPATGDSNKPLAIGTLYPYGSGAWSDTSHAFDGRVDEVQVYRRALTAKEVTELVKLEAAEAGVLYQYTYDELGNVAQARMAPIDLAQPTHVSRNGQLGDGDTGSQDWDHDGVAENFDRWQLGYVVAGSSVLVTLTSSSFEPILRVYPVSTEFAIIGSSGEGSNTVSLLCTSNSTDQYWYVDVISPTAATGSYQLDWLVNPFSLVPNALAEFTYTYDEAGNLIQAIEGSSVTAGLTGITEDAYDALGRLAETKQSVGGTVNKRANYNYRNDGQFDTITRYADDGSATVATTDYSDYDDLGRLRTMSHTYGPANDLTTLNYTWTYDIASRIDTMTSLDGSSTFTLDATNQLTAADHSYQDDESYDYDDNGNRESVDGVSYTTGTCNQLTSDGVYTYQYDAEGNRTLRYVDADASGTLNAGDTDITTYDWDHRNRLTGVTHYASDTAYAAESPDTFVQYTYDYLNRRVRKKVDSDGVGAGAADYFYNVHQGDNVALEIHDQNGLATGGTSENAPHLAHRYFYGAAVDQILASEDETGEVLWGLADQEGTVRDVVGGAVRSWNSESRWKLDEGSGTTATDSTGHDHDGTLLNGAVWTRGVSGTAISLDGQNDYVEVPDCSELKYQGGALTLSVWVYVNPTETSGGWLISKPWNGNGEYNYGLHLETNNSVSLSLQSQLLLTSPSALSTGQWHNVVATVDDANLMTLYVDGQSVASDYHTIANWTPAMGDTLEPLAIGTLYPYGSGAWSYTGHAFDGKMDEVRVYRRALTADEVVESMKLEAEGRWKFDENNGTTATDSTGCDHDGTLLNGAVWTSGVSGAAISLDGQNDYVEVPDCSELKYQGGELTLSVWVYVNPTETTGGWLISKPWSGNGEYNYGLHLETNNTVSLSLQSQLLLTSPSALSTGQWHNVVATVDDANLMTLYVDGQSVASDYHTIVNWTPAMGDTLKPLAIGTLYPYGSGAWSYASHAFDGKMDEARLYRRALTADEVEALWETAAEPQPAVEAEHRTFDSFGQSTSTWAVDFQFGFTGRPWDADTALYDNRARWYDPRVGRWLTEDPTGYSAGDMNLYRYCGNSPVDLVDPSGLCYSGLVGSVASAIGKGVSSIVSTYVDAGAYLWGVGAASIDCTLGTNLASLGTPSVHPSSPVSSVGSSVQTSLTGIGQLTPFVQGVSAFNTSVAQYTVASQHSWNSQVADWGRALYNGGDRAGLAQPSDGGQFGNNIGAQAIQDWASAANGGTNLGGFLANSVLWVENTGMAAINELAMMSNYGQPVFTEPLPYVDVPDWSRNWAAPESDFAHNAKMLFGEMATGFIIGEVASGYAAAEGTFAVRSGTAPTKPYSNLADHPSVGPGKNFTATQKAKIYQENMARNTGVLRSDLTGEELVMPSKSAKGVTPPANEAQIDHVIPRRPGDPSVTPGSNSYSNAQVLSRQQNRLKSNK